MTTITYNPNIPNGPNNPSDDWSLMKVNTNSNSSIWTVDHFTFGTGVDGTHSQSTYTSLGSGPTTNSTQGAVYTKTVSGNVVLFYRGQSNGTEIQLTNASGLINVPTILTGTFTSTGSFTNIVLLPVNVYGIVYFFTKGSGGPAVQTGQFFTDSSKCYGFSNRVVTNSSSNDDPIELNNSSSTLNLQGMRDDFSALTVNYRVQYWAQ